MTDFPIKIGDGVTFAKTITETDVYLFAGITGDFSPVHVNRQVMERSRFGRRLVHGALVSGLMSTASWMANEKYPASGKETCQRRCNKGPCGGVKRDHSAYWACPRSPREGPARAAACLSMG